MAFVGFKCDQCLKDQRSNAPRGLQDPGHPGFVEKNEPYDCGQCIEWHATRYGFPMLDNDSNRDAWQFYQRLQGQQRIGMDVIGIDICAVPIVFDVHHVPDEERPVLLDKILSIDRVLMDDRNRKREIEKSKKEAERRLDNIR